MRYLIAVYAAIGIFTFGHSAANYEFIPQYTNSPDPTPFLAGFAGGLWPLYWAWEMQE